jgi:hypothetical protein
MERPFFSMILRSPNGPDMPYVCGEKTSAAMACCDEKGLGGDDEEELLMEPCMNGLLERFEGLVLLGLGPPAISSLSSRVCGGRVGNKERRLEGGEADAGGCQKRQIQVSTAGRAQRQRQPGCKTASKRGDAQVNF